MSEAIEIRLNGEPYSIATGATVMNVVEALRDRIAGLAVAQNGTIVPRSAWATTPVNPGDLVEIVTVAAGG